MPNWNKMKKPARSGGLNFGTKGKQGGGNTDVFPTHYGVQKGPLNYSPAKETSEMQKKSIEKDPRYGKLSSEEYEAEVTRQSKHHKATGDWDAMGVYDHKGDKKKIELQKIEPKKAAMPEAKAEEPIRPTGEPPEIKSKEKKKSWLARGWDKFKKHHESGEARKIEAHFQDAAQAIGGKGYTGPKGSDTRADIARQENLRLKEENLELAEKKSQKADTESKIRNEQRQFDRDLINKQRELNIQKTQRAIDKDTELDATESFAVTDEGNMNTYNSEFLTETQKKYGV